jgi:hypothetical protein
MAKTNQKAAAKKVSEARAVSPWINSKAKKQLYHDIIDGTVTDGMAPGAVFLMRPEFQVYKEENFKTNFKSLKKAIRAKQGYAVTDSAAFANDRRVNPLLQPTGRPRWNGSAAERFLKEDIEEGLHMTMKPAALYQTRQEYQVFALDVFRPHIHQEIRSSKGNAYWLAKKLKKKQPLF